MTLTRILEIETRFLQPGDATSLGIAEGIWRSHGSPTDAKALADILEKVMRECSQSGVYYAAVILKRKKSLERGTWKPAPQFCEPPRDAGATQPGMNGVKCSQCGDTGYIQMQTHASLCRCGAWNKSRAKVQ
jgi:hypothetical protein